MADDRAEALLQRGYALIRDGSHDAALRVAGELEELRHAGAAELAALAHAGRGELDTAVDVLERGVERAPLAGSNWQLLGTYRAELGRLDEARSALERALACPDAWHASVRLDLAHVALRSRDPEAALRSLDGVEDEELALELLSARMRALAALDRCDEAERLGARMLEDAGDESDDPGLSAVAAQVALLRVRRGDDRAAVRAFAVRRWTLDPASDELLAAVREIDGRRSPTAHGVRVLVHGEIPANHAARARATGFFASADAVADSAEEALELVRALDQREPRALLQLVETEVLEPKPDELVGVYRVGERTFYEGEGAADEGG